MNSGEVPLDDAIKLYEEADRLIKQCQTRLTAAEQKLEKLVKESTGQLHGAAEHALKRIRTAKAAERPPATPSGNSP